jgi:putative MATE family efflux protein
MLFSKEDLQKLIIPLIIEQLLAVTVGLADSIMVARVGEAAISAVSLVDSINVLLINVFAALATGGAVVAGQYLGSKKESLAREATEQLIVFNTLVGICIMIIMYLGTNFILTKVFGNIEPDVMRYSRQYMMIVMAAVPFIAIYNSGAAILRTMGNSALSLKISAIMNVINIVGNAILIYGFQCGVEGVAIPTLVSRVVAAIIVIVILRNQELVLHISKPFKYKTDAQMVKKILHIGIPSGVENSMFQLGKILLLSLVSSFGTVQITANAVSNTIAAFEILPGSAIGLAMVTVISRCIGAGDYEQVKYYTKKLMKTAYIWMVIVNIGVMCLLPFIMKVYNLSSATSNATTHILVLHGICAMFIWPLSFTLPNMLRASNDVRYTMIVGVCSMWFCRILCGIFLGKYMGLKTMGVWIAMIIDWIVRSIFFVYRYRSEKWKKFSL